MARYQALTEHFKDRHIGPDDSEIREMLEAVGADSIDQLMDETVPAGIRLSEYINLPEGVGETEMLEQIREKAQKNKVYKSFIGQGYYDTHTPGVIKRNVLENPGWYTAYTPYQPEIAQGRLTAILNYQTMVCDLTGMEIANASLLDEATAAAEAMLMFHSQKKRNKGEKFFVSDRLFPQTKQVLETRAEPVGIEIVYGDHNEAELDSSYFGALVQYPDDNGAVDHYESFISYAHEQNVSVVVAADLLSLVLLTPPGEWGADCVVGSSQRFGVPMGYGGPHAAFFATRDSYKRKIPGRLIGLSKDKDGKPASRMALQTREQHIRREKATSNICTAQVLLANMAAFYAIYHGPEGLKNIAKRVHGLAKALDRGARQLGFNQVNEQYFDTLKIDLGDENAQLREQIHQKAIEKEINLRYFENENAIGISVDETKELSDVQDVLNILAEVKQSDSTDVAKHFEEVSVEAPAEVARESSFLTHPVFNSYHSETKMLRYLKYLENQDLSLAHSMIPLGSCTMKLNATTEMEPVSWPEFSKIHPYTPSDQVQGYDEILNELTEQLKAVTGFPAISNQPNAGAQGEYTGLMTIRAYHKDRGEGHRNVAIIPTSAHGTNPASAVMAGMKVVGIGCDEEGNIDLNELKQKAEENSDHLAALMVTYPSTHGVFEEDIQEICRVIHEHGGQVYMDGANLNAQLGITTPGTIGADVCHLNLHKTFTIPHGGGGPGMGPIGVASHLAPYLPNHIYGDNVGGEKGLKAVASAPHGSSNILIISYIFNKLMGAEGLTESSKVAILNTNYIKERLQRHYSILYTGKHGRAAHEMIIDPRELKESAGIEAEDIAKRLMDYGFHAPTMSFPVPGTLMVEPTESESKDELDRFCDAMISIRQEIEEVAKGQLEQENNPLVNAPHTMDMLMADEWHYPYTRERAAYPLSWLRTNKFWPTVARVDGSYGDRNLMCACPPVESYEETASASVE